MKNFKNSTAGKLLTSILIVILLFNFAFPTYSQASIYGDLFSPIAKLLVGIGDAVLNMIQKEILGFPAVEIIENDNVTWDWWDIPLTFASLGLHGALKLGADIGDWITRRDGLSLSIYYGPGTIFAGKIPLFSIDFFNANPVSQEQVEQAKSSVNNTFKQLIETILNKAGEFRNSSNDKEKGFYEAIIEVFPELDVQGSMAYSAEQMYEKRKSEILEAIDVTQYSDREKYSSCGKAIMEYNQYNIFSTDWYSKIENLDGEVRTQYAEYSSQQEDASSIAGNLKVNIASWYKALQTIALVLLLSILIYIGIRIIISSTAQEKAKYKSMIKDWLFAIILLFVLHYIMVGIVSITNELVNIFSQATQDGDEMMTQLRLDIYNVLEVDEENGLLNLLGYTVMYIMMIFYTVMFSIKYLKRVIYMAFLTLIAPVICLTYPLDKISDGKSQAFDMWFKEYLYNALIQILHLILYLILVSSAIDLAKEHIIYALVALGFILQGEKILKQMFGFNKAQGGALSGVLTGAAMMQGLNMLSRKAIPSRETGNNKSNQSAGGKNIDKPKMNELAAAAYSTPNADQQDERNKDETVQQTDGSGNENGNGNGGTQPINQNPTSLPTNENNGSPMRQQNGATYTGQERDTTKNESATNKKKKKLNSTAAGIGAVAKRYVNKNTGKKALRSLARGTLKAASMATLGTVGVAAGLASDDFSNVFKYGGAAALVGNKVGNNLYNLGDQVIGGGINGAKNIRETYKYGKYGETYDDLMQEKQIKKHYKDPDVIRMYQKNFTNPEEVKEAIRFASECNRMGINDDETIINSYKLGDNYTREQKQYIAGLSTKNTSGKDLKQLRESLADRNLSGKQINDIIKGIKDVNRLA